MKLRDRLPSYHLGHVDLQCVNEEKDLGVMITSKLTWETQVLMVSAKANNLRDVNVTIPLFKLRVECNATR